MKQFQCSILHFSSSLCEVSGGLPADSDNVDLRMVEESHDWKFPNAFFCGYFENSQVVALDLVDASSAASAASTDLSDADATTSRSFHVSPTRTVARRDVSSTEIPIIPVATPLANAPYNSDNVSHVADAIHLHRSIRHKRMNGHLSRLD